MDDYFGRAVAVNFLILLMLFLLSCALHGDKGIELFMWGYLYQSGINFAVGLILLFTKKWYKLGQALMVSTFLILLIGFGLCAVRLGIR